jgi:ribosomal protein L37AE/L43A
MMPEKSCPECPSCGGRMKKDSNGVCICQKCGAAFIPSGCKGIFVPASGIGIHSQ